MSKARNCGINRTTGIYVTTMDADDLYARGAFSSNVFSILKTEKYDVVTFSSIKCNQEIKWGIIRKQTKNEYERTEQEDIYEGPMGHHNSVFHRRVLRGINFPEGYVNGEDGVFRELVREQVRRACVRTEFWYIYRMNRFSMTKNKDYRKTDIDWYVSQMIYGFNNAKSERTRNNFYKNIIKRTYRFAEESIGDGREMDELISQIKQYEQLQLVIERMGLDSFEVLLDNIESLPVKKIRTKGLLQRFIHGLRSKGWINTFYEIVVYGLNKKIIDYIPERVNEYEKIKKD